MKLNTLGELFALPIQSAIRAQSLALQETLAIIEDIGIENGKATFFQLKTERMVEDPTGGGETKVQPLELRIPLLALLPIASMQLQEMDMDFGVEVIETKASPIRSRTTPSTIQGSSLSGSMALFTALGQSNPTTIKVHMKITRVMPEGMARVEELLTDLLSVIPQKEN